MRDWIRQKSQRVLGPKVKIEHDRASLRAFDSLPLIILLMSFVLLFLAGILSPPGTLAIGLGIVLCFSSQSALMVNVDGAFGERSVMGIVYRRVELGRHPQLEFGLVWDWSEISVSPTEPHIDRSVLHDQGRFVIFEYNHDDDALYKPLVHSMRREINRLHGVPRYDGWS